MTQNIDSSQEEETQSVLSASDQAQLDQPQEPIALFEPDLDNRLSSGLISMPSNELNEFTQDFLTEYAQGIAYGQRPIVSPIEVDELAAKLAKTYEKIRRIVDWKDENLIRRTAIERILKRTLLSELSGIGQSGLDAEKITGPLVMEMVRSGYFDNNQISKNKIPIAKQSLVKYIYILNNSPHARRITGKRRHKSNLKLKINFYNWILEIAACEIEEILAPAFPENALINYMTSSIFKKLRVTPSGLMNEEEILLQTYIAVQRSLYSLDEPIITYNLIKYRYPRWFDDDTEFIANFAQNINQIQTQLELDLENKYSKEFFKVCEQMDAAYLIFGDVMKEIDQDPATIEAKLKDRKTLAELITTVYDRRLKTLKTRLYRGAIYSTLSIFVAGIASYALFEGPVAQLFGNGFSWLAVLVDLGVPSALMFLLVITIKPPNKNNLVRVKQEIYKILYHSEEKDEYEVTLVKKRNKILNAFFSLISLLGGVTGAFAVYTVFRVAGVPWTSLYIDTMSVAMILFAATVVRHKAQELSIQESGGLVSMTVDFFYLPLAKVGQWFSTKWKEYNVVSVFFTALIDTPFSMILGIIEDWRSFLRDRRSEIH